MKIQEQEIKRIIHDEKEYRYARFLDAKKMIERMTVSLDETNDCYRVNARIHNHDEKYTLSIRIGKDGSVIQNHCSCHLGGCRHIGSILFYLKNTDIVSFPYCYEEKDKKHYLNFEEMEKLRQQKINDRKQQEALSLIELYKDELLRESLLPLSSQQYRISLVVKQMKDHLWVGLKIYNGHSGYVIKNITNFFHALDHHESMKYGKSFEFIHSYDVFDDDSKEILYFLKDVAFRNRIIQDGTIKALQLSREDLDKFYDIMAAMPSYYCDITFDKREYTISIDISKKEEWYILDFKEYDIFHHVLESKSYFYTLENDVLYRYDFHQNQKMMTFIKKMLASRGGLYIPKDSLYDFYKYVLIDFIDDLDIDLQYFHDYYQENMINLYGDMTKDEQICLQIEYIYDDHIGYAYQQENKSKEADLIEKYLEPYIEDIDDNMIYLTYDHDFSYHFMKEGLPYLAQYCHVYVSDNLQSISKQQPMRFQIGISVSHGLLHVNIDSLDVDKYQLYDMIKAYKKKSKFYKLKNGQILSLENSELKELSELSDILQLKSKDFIEEDIELPAYRLFEIDNYMESQKHIEFLRSEEFKHWIDQIKQPKNHFDIPSAYHQILRSYQIEGYQWLRMMEQYGFGGILADDMGLGKTLQMIVYLESIKGHGTSLVVTPASLLLNWQDEIMKFTSSLRVLCVYGHKSSREMQLQDILEYDVVLTSYDYLRRDVELYEKIQFHTIIIDEAQYIKNPKTQNAICVKRLSSHQRFALTGTPIENSLAELWSIFDFLMPHYLYHYSYFLEKFEKPIVKEHDQNKQEQLRKMITPFVLRRNKKDVLKELPEKIEQTLFLAMNDEEQQLYLSNLVQVNKSLQKKLDMQQLGRIDILAMLTRLRQLCQDPRLLYSNIETPSSKLKGCMELIHSLKDNHKKILLFSSFTSVLHLIEEQCQKEHVSYYLLDGSVPKEKRKAMVDAFQQDDTTLFLISLKAGGSGLNLTSAQAVIHYDPWWNMSAKNQATDRAYRMGQQHNVQVFSLIMKNSIEEKIMDLQNQKKNLADAFVEGHDGSIGTMSVEDLKSLFEIEAAS